VSPTVIFYELSPIIISSQDNSFLGASYFQLPVAELPVPPRDATALASINDDRFDGNIFVLYGGNGSLVPPKVTLAKSLAGIGQRC